LGDRIKKTAGLWDKGFKKPQDSRRGSSKNHSTPRQWLEKNRMTLGDELKQKTQHFQPN